MKFFFDFISKKLRLNLIWMLRIIWNSNSILINQNSFGCDSWQNYCNSHHYNARLKFFNPLCIWLFMLSYVIKSLKFCLLNVWLVSMFSRAVYNQEVIIDETLFIQIWQDMWYITWPFAKKIQLHSRPARFIILAGTWAERLSANRSV